MKTGVHIFDSGRLRRGGVGRGANDRHAMSNLYSGRGAAEWERRRAVGEHLLETIPAL